MSLATAMIDFRSLLITASSAATVCQDRVPEDDSRPYVWFAESNVAIERTHDGVGGLVTSNVAVECWNTTRSLADGVRNGLLNNLDGYRGTTGTTQFLSVFCEAADDDYEPRGTHGDDGLFVSALTAELCYRTT